MRIVDYTGVLTLRSPVHHGGEDKTGNDRYVRTIVYMLDGKQVEVPIISGNSIRHTLRDWLAQDLLDAIGYQQEDEKKFAKVWHCLTGGGTLETKNEKDAGIIDLKLKAKIRAMLPVFALFGGTMGNQSFEGKIDVGFAIPIVQELAAFLPAQKEELPKLREIVHRDLGTKHDKFRHLAEGDEKSNQMLYFYWYLAPGTTMHHRFTLRNPSQIEEAAFSRAVQLWRLRPVVGGKAGTGLGRVDLQYSPELPDSAPWQEFLQAKKDDISALLQQIEASI
jgi:hypothetical protein